MKNKKIMTSVCPTICFRAAFRVSELDHTLPQRDLASPLTSIHTVSTYTSQGSNVTRSAILTYFINLFIHQCIPNYTHTKNARKGVQRRFYGQKSDFFQTTIPHNYYIRMPSYNYKYYNFQMKMEFRKKSVEWRPSSFFEFG